MIRLFFLLIIAVGLAPGTWIRTDVTSCDYAAPLEVTAIADPAGVSGEFALSGLWELNSRNDHHHGYSALAVLPNGNLLAGSDRGRALEIPLREGIPVANGASFGFFPGTADLPRYLVDLEALTVANASGITWAAFEQSNSIDRVDANGEVKRSQPSPLAAFKSNGGPETLARLTDGRFLVLAELPEERGLSTRPGVLFDRDPTDPAADATAFRFAPPQGYAPVDAAALPDGDLLILLRRVRYALPAAQFDGAILRADPSEIAPDSIWRGQIVAEIGGPDLADNFEGIAFVPAEAETTIEAGSIFLISDDNQSIFQQSLLAKLRWRTDPERLSEPEK